MLRRLLAIVGPAILFAAVLLALTAVANAQESAPPASGAEDAADLERRVEDLEARLRAVEEAGPPAAPAEPCGGEETGGLLGWIYGHLCSTLEGTCICGAIGTSYTVVLPRTGNLRGSQTFRAFDRDEDQFSFDLAAIIIERAVGGPGDLGFRLAGGFGRTVDLYDLDPNVGSPDDLSGVLEAWVAYALPWIDVEIRAGVFPGFSGTETWLSVENPTVSRSLVYTFGGPRSLTGLAVSLPLPFGARYTQVVANGWDRISDDNGGKTFGGRFDLGFLDDGFAGASWLYGAEQPGEPGPKRFAANLFAEVPLVTGVLRLHADATAGHEEDRGQPGPLGVRDAAWYGMAATLALTVDLVSVALRGDWFRDEQGAVLPDATGLPLGLRHLDVGNVTLTIAAALLDHIWFRVEWRYDRADQRVFGRNGNHRDQNTFGFEMFVRF